MPKAEKGTPKDLANRMKSRGLQKLAFYCQVCEKQMRDQNGFKQHCASEPHVRMMLLVGQNPSKAISDYSRQFKHDFLQLLRTAHGEKRVQVNHFYQEYIQNKSHIHMNGTHWKTLSEFAKSLGREGICRVDEGEKGLFIAWIDNSPEALSRQAAIKKKDRQDKGDEERALQLLAEQIERAKAEAQHRDEQGVLDSAVTTQSVLDRRPDEKIRITFGNKKGVSTDPPRAATTSTAAGDEENLSAAGVQVGATLPATTRSTKKPNVFGSQKPVPSKGAGHANARSSSASSLDKKGLSNAQQMILEQQERNRRQEVYSRYREEENSKRARVT